MQCSHCGADLPNGARFCPMCTAPIEAQGGRRVRTDADQSAPRPRTGRSDAPRRTRTPDNSAADPHRRRLAGYEPRQNDARRTPAAEEEYRAAVEPRRAHYAGSVSVPAASYQTPPADSEQAPYSYPTRTDAPSHRSDTPSRRNDVPPHRGSHSSEPPKKKSKKALWISLIALILVIAILSGVIFIITTVSAKEVQEAKDNYEPPVKAVTIDTSLKDPSNDKIRFEYDDRDRIITCTYSIKEKEYVQTYDYDDILRLVEIVTSYKDHPIYTKEIPYDTVEKADTFEEVDGYYVRLDEESKNGGAPEPTEARTITDASELVSDEELKAFLTYFISWYQDGTPYETDEIKTSPDTYYGNHREYDYRAVDTTTQNILTNICFQLSCIDWNLYAPEDSVVHDSSVPKTNCPWWESSEYDLENTAMGVETFDRKATDSILQNIFHVTEKDIETLYKRGLENQKIWRDQTEAGECYCILTFGIGGPGMEAKVKDVKTDGTYYYVTYDMCAPYQTNTETFATFYAIMGKEKIDGKDYWTMYVHTKDIPKEITPFDPNAKAPKANEAVASSDDYKQLYIDYLDSMDKEYHGGKLFYLNDDSIPELAINISIKGARTFAYRICWIADGKVQSTEINANGYHYQERSGALTSVYAAISSGGFTNHLFDGKSFTESNKGNWTISTDGTLTKIYQVDGAEVSEDTYNTTLGDIENRQKLTDDLTDADALNDYIRNFE